MPGLKVTHREFVVTWTRSNSIAEVASTTGMTVAGVAGRAKLLRKAGVNLKKFDRLRGVLTDFDVAQLNSLIKKTEKG